MQARIRDSNITSEKLAEYVELLFQLKEPDAELQQVFLSWHKNNLQRQLEKFSSQVAVHLVEMCLTTCLLRVPRLRLMVLLTAPVWWSS